MNISVIIPVFNAEKYLTRCIQSVLTQQIYELILINDGSSDSSAIICDLFSKQDNRVKVFHQENKGVSAARNFALECVNGDWVVFVDADDYVEADWIETLANVTVSQKADIYLYGYRYIGFDYITQYSPDNGGVNKEEFVKSAFYNQAVWSYLFKLSVIRENNITFPVDLKYSEDQAFLLKYLSVCQSVIMVNNALYNYCANPQSTLYKPLSAIRIIYNLQAANDYLQFCNNKKVRIIDFSVWRLYEDFFLFYPQVKSEYSKECQKLYNEEYKKTLLYYPEFRKYLYFRLSSYNLYWMDIVRRFPQKLTEKWRYFVRKGGNLKRKITKWLSC